MSEITERTNIVQVAEIDPIQEFHASMVQLGAMSNYEPVQTVMPDISSLLPENILAAINAKVGGLNVVASTTCVNSPNSLRKQFKKTFAPVHERMTREGLSALNATKASVIAAVSRMDLKIDDRKSVSNKVKAIVKAQDSTALQREVKSLMSYLEVSHTKVFTTTLARACTMASHTVGFKNVEVKHVLGKLEVIATNKIGQRLISEIAVDAKTNVVNMSTETIGILDGSCSKTMNQFNEALRRMGIKFGNAETKFTGGICQMSYAKMIDQQDKVQRRRKAELERLRKLDAVGKQRTGG